MYNLVLARLDEDVDNILTVWSSSLSPWSYDLLSWFYQENPCGQPIIELAFDKNSMVVGSASMYPIDLFVGGKQFRAGVAANFAILDKHRVFGPAIHLQRALIDDAFQRGYEVLIAFPNQKARGVFERVGYKEIGTIAIWSKLLRSGSKLSDRFKCLPLAGVLGWLVDIGMLLYDCMWQIISPGFNTEISEPSDDHFNELWCKASAHLQTAVERNSGYLNWRYGRNPRKLYKFFCLTDKNTKELHGYIVYSINNGICQISDILVSDNKYMNVIISKFVITMRMSFVKAILIGLIFNENIINCLRRHLFIKRQEQRSIYVLSASGIQDSYCDKIYNVKQWYALEDDVDL